MAVLSFLGKGLSFPFKVVSATGRVAVTEGNTDDVSVALEYLSEAWTIREEIRPKINHVAESIAHILLTKPGEHDTLPPFGSQLYTMIFEPNSYEFRQQAEAYFKFSTKRWEHRAYVPERFGFDQSHTIAHQTYSGVRWAITGMQADRGEAPVWALVEFITQQTASNMVAPFVTIRDARILEYSPGAVDAAAHDRLSRYFNRELYTTENIRSCRLKANTWHRPARDDTFYHVKPGDSWLLVSWANYQDIRYWDRVAQVSVYDQAILGASRDTMDTTGDPISGHTLRLPSKTRLLMEVANA